MNMQTLEKLKLKIANDLGTELELLPSKINFVPEVSIIIPFRDNISLLKKTILALDKQSFKKFELIIVDDASKENYISFFKNLREYITYIKYKRSNYELINPLGNGFSIRRAGQIRNKGAENARGRILIFLDSDIIVKPDFIRKHLDNHNKKNIVVLGLRNNDERKEYLNLFSDVNEMKNPWKLLHSHNFSLTRKNFFKVGGFSDYFCFWGGEDEELGYKLFKNGLNFILDKQIIGIHQDHESEQGLMLKRRYAAFENYMLFYNQYKDQDILDSYRQDINKYNFNVFDKCNNHCVFCNHMRKNGKYLSTDIIEQELQFAHDMNIKIRLGGGELTLHPEFDNIVKIISKNKYQIELCTNARAFSYDSTIKSVIPSINNFFIYVYGTKNTSYYKITKDPNSYNQAMKGISNIVNAGGKIAFNVVVNNDTVDELNMIISELSKITPNIRIKYIPFDIDGKFNKKDFEKNKIKVKKQGYLLTDSFFSCDDTNNEIKQIRSCLQCPIIKECRKK